QEIGSNTIPSLPVNLDSDAEHSVHDINSPEKNAPPVQKHKKVNRALSSRWDKIRADTFIHVHMTWTFDICAVTYVALDHEEKKIFGTPKIPSSNFLVYVLGMTKSTFEESFDLAASILTWIILGGFGFISMWLSQILKKIGFDTASMKHGRSSTVLPGIHILVLCFSN
ncbi:hypothetical protein ACJX0J_023912, partial [Zea mays]